MFDRIAISRRSSMTFFEIHGILEWHSRMTIISYCDLDVSIIDETPRNRGKIITTVHETSKRGEVLRFLRAQLEAGRQLYVIYPLIDETEKLDVKAASVEYELWRERLHTY